VTLTTPSDVSLLQAVADPDRYRILIHLLKAPATQKELADALKVNSGTMSKHMQVLRSANLARRGRRHSSYEPLHEERLRELLRAAANLKLEIIEEQASIAADEAAALSRAGIRIADDPSQSEIA
jgi:DNA-binding transcriptional ArsR family regulator